jgi:hypothetical protein
MPHQNLGSNSLACATHVIGDAAFVDDTLFMPDGGTARANPRSRDLGGNGVGEFSYSNFDIIAPRAMFSLCRYNYRII